MARLRLRPATREERQLALLWFAAAAAAAVLRPVWIAAAPLLRPCTFRGLTGIPCPTCGTTRVALALLDLDLATAFGVNPLATIAGAAFFAGGALALIWVLLRAPAVTLDGGLPRWWVAVLAAVVLANLGYLIAGR
jgi:hypothetical protein